MKVTYKTCVDVAKARKEHNDCAVKAVAIATGIGYNQSHTVFSKLGRRNGRGVDWMMLVKAIEHCTGNKGKFTSILKPNGTFYTGKTIGQALPNGKYILMFRGHVAAMVDGKIEDWTENTKKCVLYFWKV